MPKYYPINIDLRGKQCLIVGGGEVALRKVRSLKKYEAQVTAVSPTFCKEFSQENGVTLVKREYETTDLDGIVLAFGATDDQAINEQVASDGRSRGIPVNIVDQPELCDFIVPATLQRGDLTISVSTGGSSPALSRKIREALEEEYEEQYETFITLLGEMRPKVIESYKDINQRRKIFHRLACDDVLATLVEKDEQAARKLMEEIVSKG